MQIAIDGPAGSGKSTISKMIAEKCDILYLDTGAMYRATALISLENKIKIEDMPTILNDAEFNFTENGKSLSLKYLLGGDLRCDDITDRIRTPEVTEVVSVVAADKDIRRILTAKQQDIADGYSVIMDGRDIGTVVLPNADYKFFLTADPIVRARRRASEWGIDEGTPQFENILQGILKRDAADSTRESSPLKKAPDAKEIDTTYLTIDEVVDIIYAVVDK